MTRLISAPTESGQLRHYFVRESTLTWRPQYGQWARLVEVANGGTEACERCHGSGRSGKVYGGILGGHCGECRGTGRVPNTDASQAIPGEIVEVIRTVTPPAGFHNDVPGLLWLEHRGGSNMVPGNPDRRHERRNVGTVGVWEHCYPITLATWPDGSRLEQLSGEDRVAALVAAFEELPPEERRAFVKRSTIGLADFDDCKEEDEGEMPEPII